MKRDVDVRMCVFRALCSERSRFYFFVFRVQILFQDVSKQIKKMCDLIAARSAAFS